MSLLDIKNKLQSAVSALAGLQQSKVDPALVKQLTDKGAAIYDISGKLDVTASQKKLQEINKGISVPVAPSGLPKVTTVKNLAPTISAMNAIKQGSQIQVVPEQKEQQITAPSVLGQETIQKSIANAYPNEKNVSVKLPFLPISIPTSEPSGGAVRTAQEFIKGFVEWPERVVNTIKQISDTSKIQGVTEDPNRVATVIDEFKTNISTDPYFMNHPTQAFALAAFGGILDIAGLGASLQSAISRQVAKLPSSLGEITESQLKLGLDLNQPVTEQTLKKAYNKVAYLTHPDTGVIPNVKKLVKTPTGYQSLTPFEEATQAKEFLQSKMVNGEIPSVSSFDRKYATILNKLDDDVRNWFKTPTKPGNLATRGLLPEKAGMKPTEPLQPYRQPAVGLSTREVKEVPVTPISKELSVIEKAKTGIIPEVPSTIKQSIKAVTEKAIPRSPITTNEKQLLVARIKAQKAVTPIIKKIEQTVAKRQSQAYIRQIERTRKQTRTEVINAFKDKQASVDQVKQDVTSFVTKFIPTEYRGKFLTDVRDASTKGDLAKVMLKVDATQRMVKADQITKNIEELSQVSETLPLDVRQKISQFLDRYTPYSMRQATIQKLKKTKEWYDKTQEYLPHRIKEKLEQLGKINFKNLSNDKLEQIESTLTQMINEGKVKARVKNEIKQLQLDTKLDQIVKNVKNFDKEIIKRKPGEELPSKLAVTQKKQTIANLIQTGDWELTFMDRFFDMLDGNKHYEGTIYKTFYTPVKHANDAYLKMADSIRKPFFDLNKKLKLSILDFEKIGIYAIKQQVNGAEKLLSNGYSQADIDAVKLTDNQKKMYDFMRQELDKLEPKIAETLARDYNKQLGHVDNYFPFQTDFEEKTPILDQVEKSYRRTSTEKGFTKQRTQSNAPVKIDAAQIFLNHIDNSSYFVNMNKDITELGKIVNNPKFIEAVGNKAAHYIQQWVDVISRKGGVTGKIDQPILNTLRRNLGTAVLGFKVSSALYQPLAKLNGAAEIGKWAFKHDLDFITKPEVRKFILDNSMEIKHRAGDDPGFIDLSPNPKTRKAQELALWTLEKLDSLTASSVWYGAYQKKLSELGIPFSLDKGNQEAIDYADRVVRITQASALPKDLPPAFVSKYRDFNRTLFTFQTFMLNDWNYIKHDLIKMGVADASQIAKIEDPTFHSGEKAKLFQKISTQVLWLISSMIAQEAIQSGLSYMYYGQDLDTFWNHSLSALMGRVPGLSQLYSLLQYEQIPVPVFGPLITFAKGYNQLLGAKGSTKLKGVSKIIGSLGAMTGIPGSSELQKLIGGPLTRQIFGDEDTTKKVPVDITTLKF